MFKLQTSLPQNVDTNLFTVSPSFFEPTCQTTEFISHKYCRHLRLFQITLHRCTHSEKCVTWSRNVCSETNPAGKVHTSTHLFIRRQATSSRTICLHVLLPSSPECSTLNTKPVLHEFLSATEASPKDAQSSFQNQQMYEADSVAKTLLESPMYRQRHPTLHLLPYKTCVLVSSTILLTPGLVSVLSRFAKCQPALFIFVPP